MAKVFKFSPVFASIALMAQLGVANAGSIDVNENACPNGIAGGGCQASIAADTAAYADVAGVARAVQNDGVANIIGNYDNNGGGEGVRILSQGNADNLNGAYINVLGDSTRINAVGTNTINAATNNITGTTNSITGTTNSITGTTNNINGTTNINASNNAATNINTGTSTGNVTVGNSANTTSLNSATNNIGVNAYNTTNNIGTGSAKSINNIGNTVATTTVTSTAGNATQTLVNNAATTRVTAGTTELAERTPAAPSNVATSSQVRVSNTDGASVDANGKISTTGATGTTAGLTVNNGYENTNGVVVTERQASISGGTTAASASTLSMNDNGARFSNAATGAPVTVTGVADGKNDFDAINVRQFAGAIAAVAAQANVPALAAGQDKTIGLGVGNFMGKTGLALGMNLRGEGNTTYKLSVSTGLNGGAKTVIGAGAAWAF